jgi:hypothetical protein
LSCEICHPDKSCLFSGATWKDRQSESHPTLTCENFNLSVLSGHQLPIIRSYARGAKHFLSSDNPSRHPSPVVKRDKTDKGTPHSRLPFRTIPNLARLVLDSSVHCHIN